MTSTIGQSAQSGQPGWKLLTVLAALVVLAHALVLKAAPAQLGYGPDVDAAGSRTLTTRSIAPEMPLPVQVAPAPTAVAKPIAAPPKNPKNIQNRPIARVNRAQAAPEIIAQTPAAPAPDVTAETLPAATPTLAAAALPVPAVAVAANTATEPIAPQIGPKTTPVNAVSLASPVRLFYKVVGMSKNMNYQANSEISWKSDGQSYEAAMKVSAFLVGSRSMTSVGKITGSGLAPTRFADKFKNELAAHFEAEKGKITFSANTPDAVWMDGVQDRVSVFFQLGGVLAANPALFPAGSNISFLTVGPRDADTWTFVIELEEDLQLMGAPMPTLKLTRKPRKEFDQKVEIWFAPSLGYLPVRNRITQQSGDFIDQQLVEVIKQ